MRSGTVGSRAAHAAAPRRAPGQAVVRRARVLKTIVEAYTRSAQPVSSAAVVRLAGLSVSTATIRNDMATLERDGMIERAHASSGRVPSARGYRRFVDQLMGPASLDAAQERTIMHQFHQVEAHAAEWPGLAVALLSRRVGAAAIASAPRLRAAAPRRLDLRLLSSRRVQLVLVVAGGEVRTRSIGLSQAVTPSWLDELRASLARRVLAGAPPYAPPAAHARGRAAQDICDHLRQMLAGGRDGRAADRVAGLSALLAQPEFRDARRVRGVLESIETGALVQQLRRSLNEGAGVRVLVGGEGDFGLTRGWSAVLAPYGARGSGRGFVGVLGPQRLPYRRAVAAVDVVARAMTNLTAARTA